MARATWEWRRDEFSIYGDWTESGISDSRSTVVAAGSSIQRVYFRVAVAASISLTTSDPAAHFADVGARIEIHLVDDQGDVVVYGKSAMAYGSKTIGPEQQGLGWNYACNWTVPTIEADIALRKAAPPPPANSLIVSVTLLAFYPYAGSGGYFLAPNKIRYDADVGFLVSTPTFPAP